MALNWSDILNKETGLSARAKINGLGKFVADLGDVVGLNQVNALLQGKENTLPTGTANQFLLGNKTLSDVSNYALAIIAKEDAVAWREDLDIYSTAEIDTALATKDPLQPVMNFSSYAEAQSGSVSLLHTWIYLGGYYTAGDNGGAIYKRVGSEPSHPGKLQTADGAWWEISEQVLSVLQFGAKHDMNLSTLTGTDNTTFFANALTTAQYLAKNLYIPGGIGYAYLTDMIDYGTPSAGGQISIKADPGTTFQKKTSDGNPLLKISQAGGGVYMRDIILDIPFTQWNGISGDTVASIQAYNMVRGVINQPILKNSLHGLDIFGAIGLTVNEPVAFDCVVNFNISHHTDGVTGGVSNQVILNNPKSYNATHLGLSADLVTELILNNPDIEGCGTVGDATTGGAKIVSASGVIGAVINGGWSEQNNGGFDWQLSEGVIIMRDAHFNANLGTTNDIQHTTGILHLYNVVSVQSKTVNLLMSSTTAGSTLTSCSFSNISCDASLVSILNGLSASGFNMYDCVDLDPRQTSIGSITSGTITPITSQGRVQRLINNGAFTLVRPDHVGEVLLEVYNGSTAGAIDLTDYSVKGESYVTTNDTAWLFRLTRTYNYALCEIYQVA